MSHAEGCLEGKYDEVGTKLNHKFSRFPCTCGRRKDHGSVTYIAGPMSGIRDFNFPAFHAAAHRLRNLGYTVVNPAELDDGNTSRPWDYYLRRDLRLLLDCEQVVLLPGWANSQGAVLEYTVAVSLGMPCRDLEVVCIDV